MCQQDCKCVGYDVCLQEERLDMFPGQASIVLGFSTNGRQQVYSFLFFFLDMF